MLINKTENSITIGYNQKKITVLSGAALDVRDFGIPNEAILPTERHILSKNPNVFDVEVTKDIFKTNKDALKKIDALEKENAKLKEDLAAAQKATGGSDDRVGKLNAEIEGLTKDNKSLKKQVGELKAKVKALQ